MFPSLSSNRVDLLPYSLLSNFFKGTGCPTNWVTRFCTHLKYHHRCSSVHSLLGLSQQVVSHVFPSPGPRKDQWPWWTLRAYFPTSTEFWWHSSVLSFFSPHNFIEHGHEDGSIGEVLRFTLHSFHEFLNLFEDAHRRESWEDFPLEFQRLSINSILFAEVILLLNTIEFVSSRIQQGRFPFFPSRAQNQRRHGPWQWHVDKLDCAISLSIPTLNLGNWSGLCQWFLSDHWLAFLFLWKAVLLFSRDNSLQISNSCHSLFRYELLLEEWYSWTFPK